MKTKLVLFALAAISFSSCAFFGVSIERGNGIPVDTVIETGYFNSVSLAASTDVIYTLTDGERSVVLTCDENLVDFYDIRVEGETLVSGVKRGTISISSRVRPVLNVCSPVLEEVRTSGSGDCTVVGPVSAEGDFRLKTSGSGEISVQGGVSCRDFFAATSGSGDIAVGGMLSTRSAEFRTSGSGDIVVKGITADAISVRTSGSGDISLMCSDAGVIDASTSGSGDIRLSGTARSIKSRHSGSGKVYSNSLTIL